MATLPFPFIGGVALEFGFSTLEMILALVHDIRPSRRSAFANRLKHFQKLGFPDGINTGRGRAAAYRSEHLIQLAMALELIEIGNVPERAVHFIRTNLLSIATGVIDWPLVDEPLIAVLRPRGLGDLAEALPDDEPGHGMFILKVSTLRDTLFAERTWSSGPLQVHANRFALISFSALLDTFALAIEKREEWEPGAFRKQASDWASGIIMARNGNS